jgi:hypothetical protein
MPLSRDAGLDCSFVCFLLLERRLAFLAPDDAEWLSFGVMDHSEPLF